MEPATPVRQEHAQQLRHVDQARLTRVHAVVPCFNRADDLARLLADLGALRLDRRPLSLEVTVVDNASDTPIEPPVVEGLDVTAVRSDENLGGSGGFNLGLRRALTGVDPPDLLWLIDSDARLDPDALAHLLDALREHPDIACVGSALAEPGSGRIFETGGFIDRRTGEYVQPLMKGAGAWPDVVRCDYVAACSMLVRREAVERAGLLPDVFVNGDDVGFCLALTRRTGAGVACAPASIAYHPTPDKMRTWARYYTARNAFANIDALGLGRRVRFVRAMRETGRAVCQVLVGRDDLADLHLAGLRDAAARRTTGPAPKGTIHFEPFTPWSRLPQKYAHLDRPTERPARKRDVAIGLARFMLGPADDVAMVTARARPAEWLAARTLVLAADEGFVVRRLGRFDRVRSLARVLWRGTRHSFRLALQTPRPPPLVPARRASRSLTLSILVLSYNRADALRRTLGALAGLDLADRLEIIVADNASTDATPDMVRREFPSVRLLALDENLGVEAFNRAAAEATGDVVLVLDDDAIPADAVLESALALLHARPDVGAVALHPRHPRTGHSEWPFARRLGTTDLCPFMGCANLVRRDVWTEVGGYDADYFLYRNDIELAMTLLDEGWKVYFDPDWVVWHDSPAAKRKSLRWFELATRNWIWTIRRHGRGLSSIVAIALGWLWAHKLAGRSLNAHWRVLRGVKNGLLRLPAAAARRGVRTGWPVRAMLAARFAR
jgi:hypothetical protein